MQTQVLFRQESPDDTFYIYIQWPDCSPVTLLGREVKWLTERSSLPLSGEDDDERGVPRL